jgi:ribosomal protein S18 acetylase RimI-like enzyme
LFHQIKPQFGDIAFIVGGADVGIISLGDPWCRAEKRNTVASHSTGLKVACHREEISIEVMNSDDVIFRTKAASAEQIFGHLNECSSFFVPELNAVVNISEYSKKIFQKSVTFEAWLNGRLVGLTAAYCNDLESRAAFITSVSVVREFIGAGIASKLMGRCISHAKLNGFIEIVLEVNVMNTPAVKLYQKYGFAIFEHKESSSLMKLSLQALSEAC